MSRKGVFAGLVPKEPDQTDVSPDARIGKARTRPILGSPDLISDTSRSPVGAIGQTLSEASERNRRAEEIEQRLAEGQTVVALDPSLILPSFVSDRMLGAPEAHESLVASIRDQGQQVPILVRPHPNQPGAYQVAFGHRRLRAVSELGLRVNAVVRNLSDEQLVVAQGQENSERQNLSYIEKARFAEQLTHRFPREVIRSSLSVHNSGLSYMLSVVARIPVEIVDLIGPAEGVGRRSWLELADILFVGSNVEKATEFLTRSEVQSQRSDERFKALVSHLKPRRQKNEPEIWSSVSGGQLARVITNSDRVELVIDRKKAPEFAQFVMEKLRALYEEQRAGHQ